MFDPIRPYLPLVKLAAVAVLCAFLFVGGCRHGEGRKALELAKAQARITSLEASLTDFIETFDKVKAEAKRAKDEAKAQAERQAGEVKAARQDAREYQQRLALTQRELDAAKRDPKCAEQLREPVCVVIY